MSTASPTASSVSPAFGFIYPVPVKDAHRHLGLREELAAADSSRNKPLHRWKMEIDDAPIFRSLYRAFAPKRHLEFGTWQGEGALYCLEECEAAVWTINLRNGESRDDGTWAYGELMENSDGISWSERQDSPEENKSWFRTDSLGFVGHKIHSAGYGNRVCHVYCDSRDWDNSAYPDGFFDTALIDGGHEADIVTSDTQRALRVLRPGGLMLWHDFCINSIAQQACESVAGVTTAISQMQSLLEQSFDKLVWIQPSWILVGIRS